MNFRLRGHLNVLNVERIGLEAFLPAMEENMLTIIAKKDARLELMPQSLHEQFFNTLILYNLPGNHRLTNGYDGGDYSKQKKEIETSKLKNLKLR